MKSSLREECAVSKLDPELFQQIRSICEHAGNLVQMGEDEFAISKYYEALALVPDPKSNYSISTFIYTALGEEYFSMKDYSEAGKCFLKALNCPGGREIGQINFRIGQCLEECGERRKAQDYLCQAYLLDGDALFSRANPKYYKIIRSEVEGTLPEEDELDLLREDDEMDIIDSILQKGSGQGSREHYTGYSGENADRNHDIYKRPRSGGSNQRRTDYEDDLYDEDDYDDYYQDGNDYYGDQDYSGDDYDDSDDRDDYDDYDDYDDAGESRAKSDFRRREYAEDAATDDDEAEGFKGVWVKIVGAIRNFVDLFK